MSINIAVVSGHLTRDPELRTTAGGTAILGFGIAVNERVKDRSGEWSDRANFIDVTMFGNRADSLSRYLAKGMKVTVSGRLKQSRWEHDGQKRSKVEIIADDVDLPPKPADARRPDDPDPAAVPSAVYDEDIPF